MAGRPATTGGGCGGGELAPLLPNPKRMAVCLTPAPQNRQLTEDMRLDAREEFHRAIVEASASRPGVLSARSTGGQRSSRVASLCGANALVHLPAKTADGGEVVRRGELVPAVIIGELLVGP